MPSMNTQSAGSQVINSGNTKKFHSLLFFMAPAMLGFAAPAAHATEAPANIGIDAPDEDMDAAVLPGQRSSEDGAARAIFKAWKQLDTSLAAITVGISIPSTKPIEHMSMSSSYGMRVHPITGKVARHNGIDIPAPRGTPIYATADGIVGRAQRLGGYGNYVEIEHGNDIETRYGHMSSYIVTPGQSVRQGDIIGYVGSTGRSTGNHLHYEVRIDGAPVNPMPFVRSDQMVIAALSGKAAMGGPE